MYKAFYGLTRNPFEISPDPYFLFSTARHNEALASIVHGVLRHKGFIVVTGEVGTGKTLLVRCLMEFLRRQEIASANVFNPCLSPLEFLRYIVGDLGIKTANQDKGSLLLELNNYLIARHRRNTTTVLIVDEAGQLALADALAASRSADSLVLLGDPLQLPQVAQAAHPGGGGRSVLEHVLDEDVTMPLERGVFLHETRRMHPDVCRFISERSTGESHRLRSIKSRRRLRLSRVRPR